MRFFGKNYVRQLPDSSTPHVGASLEQLIAKELPAAAEAQRALQAARADAAKRQRAEDRAVARMLGEKYED